MSKLKPRPTRPDKKSSPAVVETEPEKAPSEQSAGELHEAIAKSLDVIPLGADFVSACPICGTHRTADVCGVDGHRFEATR